MIKVKIYFLMFKMWVKNFKFNDWFWLCDFLWLMIFVGNFVYGKQ